jgi:hypothetical protein
MTRILQDTETCGNSGGGCHGGGGNATGIPSNSEAIRDKHMGRLMVHA